MANRLIIYVEFSKNDLEDLKLYGKLKGLSRPGATIKDILKGVLPLEILKDKEEVDNEQKR